MYGDARKEMMRVLVTGSSGGIGGAVVSAVRESDPAAEIIGWDIAAPDTLLGTRTTLIDHRDVEAVASAASQLGAVDILICCAGEALAEEQGLGRELPDAKTFAASIAVNLTGHYNVVRSVVPSMSEGGSIVLITSINALRSFGLTPYSVAKSGLHGLVLALAQELGRRDIRINAVALGTVDTPAHSRKWSTFVGHRQRMESLSLTGRVLTPAEAARSICSVALAMPGLTGQIVVIDNGQTVATPREMS